MVITCPPLLYEPKSSGNVVNTPASECAALAEHGTEGLLRVVGALQRSLCGNCICYFVAGIGNTPATTASTSPIASTVLRSSKCSCTTEPSALIVDRSACPDSQTSKSASTAPRRRFKATDGFGRSGGERLHTTSTPALSKFTRSERAQISTISGRPILVWCPTSRLKNIPMHFRSRQGERRRRSRATATTSNAVFGRKGAEWIQDICGAPH
jgi:hypothetical protein